MPINPNCKPNWRPTHDLAPRFDVHIDSDGMVPQTANEALTTIWDSNDSETIARIADYDGRPDIQFSVAEELAQTLHPHLFGAPLTDKPTHLERKTTYGVSSEPLLLYLARQAGEQLDLYVEDLAKRAASENEAHAAEATGRLHRLYGVFESEPYAALLARSDQAVPVQRARAFMAEHPLPELTLTP